MAEEVAELRKLGAVLLAVISLRNLRNLRKQNDSNENSKRAHVSAHVTARDMSAPEDISTEDVADITEVLLPDTTHHTLLRVLLCLMCSVTSAAEGGGAGGGEDWEEGVEVGLEEGVEVAGARDDTGAEAW